MSHSDISSINANGFWIASPKVREIWPNLRNPIDNYGALLVMGEIVFEYPTYLFFPRPLCPIPLQLTHTLLPLSIAVVTPSLFLQDQVHVRFVVASHLPSVVFDPTPWSPKSSSNSRDDLSSLIMNLLLLTFLKRTTNRCAFLQSYYCRRWIVTSLQPLYVARRRKRASGTVKRLKHDTWWARCLLFILCHPIPKRS